MKNDLAVLKQIAHGLAQQFGETCEVVIHDVRTPEMEGTVVCIENGKVSNRKLGDGPSHVVLEALKNGGKDVADRYGYLTRTKDGRVFRSSTMYMRDENGDIMYVFGINSDITNLMHLQQIVNQVADNAGVPNLTHDTKASAGAERITTSVADLLDDLIEQAVQQVGKPAQLMNKAERIEALKFLNDSGAFLISKAADKIGEYFGISRFTLYSDLNMIKDKEKEQ
ncbi:helix-turn-helix transcriptional regulator [Veillonella criceti]|uniref:Uncharacterized protein conserved in bacteria n=1 Tax=Veillonella criceti TaxID=103891 RepID=A0A380NLS7_9FIRM|nr:helix-turn-helix transcriptional regulator [Veillonella criceti]SUP42776.1 Uncharacterized protein conserved in bacteria [Veillonella criceti]